MEDATINKPLVSVGEAAAIAGKRESVADRLTAAGTLPSARLLVRWGVLDAWLAGDGEDVAALPTDGRSA